MIAQRVLVPPTVRELAQPYPTPYGTADPTWTPSATTSVAPPYAEPSEPHFDTYQQTQALGFWVSLALLAAWKAHDRWKERT